MRRCKHNKLRLQQQNFALVEYLFSRFTLLLKYLLSPFQDYLIRVLLY